MGTGMKGKIAPNATHMPVGTVFGRLTIVSDPIRHRDKSGRSRIWYVCRCSCGTEREFMSENLRQKRTLSCGCYAVEKTSEASRTHNKSDTPIYAIWNMMLQRCYLPTNKAYHNYGGRGIKVCERWHKFEGFFEDMGDVPFDKASLDRIDNSKGYEPGNVRWATKAEQAHNKRNNVRYEYKGHNLLLVEWAELTGIPRATLASRVIIYGWPLEKALTYPVINPRAKGHPIKLVPREIPLAANDTIKVKEAA